MSTFKDKFKNFADLAAHKKEGVDYEVVVRKAVNSNVAIVAPHGGNIEWNTGRMAEEIAGGDHNLYIFKGKGTGGGFENLHVTSVHFDEPRCIDLVAKADVTLTIHGCHHEEPIIFLSAMDKKLEARLSAAFNKAGIKALTTDHPYKTGAMPENICNKNSSGQGVQIEFSRGVRDNDELREKAVRAVRETLKKSLG